MDLERARLFWSLELGKFQKSVEVQAVDIIKDMMCKARAAYLIDTALDAQRQELTLDVVTPHLDPTFRKSTDAIRMIPMEAFVYIDQTYTYVLKKPEYKALFAQHIFAYFREKPQDALVFANLVYPGMFGYFVVRDFIDGAYHVLEHTLKQGYSEVGGLMFAAFFNGFPHFQHSLFTKFFDLLEVHKKSFHDGAFFALLCQSVKFAARYLCREHREAMLLAIEKYADSDFLAEYFVKRVLQNGFERFWQFNLRIRCPMGSQQIQSCFQKITEAPEPMHKRLLSRKIAEEVTKVDISFVSLPSLLQNTTEQLVITSAKECRIMLEMWGNLRAGVQITESLQPFSLAVRYSSKEVSQDKQYLFQELVRGFPEPTAVSNDSKDERHYRRFVKETNEHFVSRCDVLDPKCRVGRVVKVRQMFSADQLEYAKSREMDFYRGIAEKFEGILGLEMENQQLRTHKAIWDDHYGMYCHQVAYYLTSRYSPASANMTFDETLEWYTSRNNSHALVLYILFEIMEGSQDKVYYDIINPRQVVQKFCTIRKAEQPRLPEYCSLTGRRKAELDKLALHLHDMDMLHNGNYCIELCTIVSLVQQIEDSTHDYSGDMDGVLKLFRYVLVKSESNRFVPAVLSFFNLYNKSERFKNLCGSETQIWIRAFEISSALMMQMADADKAVKDDIKQFLSGLAKDHAS